MTTSIFRQSHHSRFAKTRHVQGRAWSAIRRCEVCFVPHFPMSKQDATPSAPAPESTAATKPLKTFRLKGVSASVFENRSEQDVPYHKVQIVRTYKSGDGFKTTSVFSRDELPIVSLVAKQSWEFILNHEAESRKGTDGE